jgi:hypothetical protein
VPETTLHLITVVCRANCNAYRLPQPIIEETVIQPIVQRTRTYQVQQRTSVRPALVREDVQAMPKSMNLRCRSWVSGAFSKYVAYPPGVPQV